MRAFCEANHWPRIYEGSVKNLYGPISVLDELRKFSDPKAQTFSPSQSNPRAVLFGYSDAFSVFDWGKMPDTLLGKGSALAVLSATWLEQLARPETWKEFSKSTVALELRKKNRHGTSFIEVGEKLQSEGLRTHYLGVLGPEETSVSRQNQMPNGFPFQLQSIFDSKLPQGWAPDHFVCYQVSAVKPLTVQVFGKALYDYSSTRQSQLPRLVPLEVVFRFGCTQGSSIFERIQDNSNYLETLGFAAGEFDFHDPKFRAGFPILELFTKLESVDRHLELSEALNISGINADKLQDLLFKTAWVSGCLRWFCERQGLDLVDGKLEWGLSDQGEVFLVDAIGPDELRILKDDVQLSKEFLRAIYRQSDWYKKVVQAKAQSKMLGSTQWKKWVGEEPPKLDSKTLKTISQLYPALTETLTGRKWFDGIPVLRDVLEQLKSISPLLAEGQSQSSAMGRR